MALRLDTLPPVPTAIEDVIPYLQAFDAVVRQSLQHVDDNLFNKTNVAPAKTEDGMLRYADGTNWDPGNGAGIYQFDGSSWTKLLSDGDAALLLTLLETVDGAGSGLDADTVDGKNPGSASGIATIGADSVLDQYADLFKTVGGTSFQVKIVNIGDWDMDASVTATITHGLTDTTIIAVAGYIRNDAATERYMFGTVNAAGTGDVGLRNTGWTSTTFDLARRTSGQFDSTDYNATSFNRGQVVILYTV